MKILLPLITAASVVAPLVAQAQQFSPARAITIAPGYGVTIIPASPVKKVWVDDGSKLGIDFDRPIEQGASILHVYQSKKAPSFSIDGSTMMTLVSEDGEIQKIRVNFAPGPIAQDTLDLRESNGRSLIPSISSTATSVSNPSAKPSVSAMPLGNNERIEIILKGLEVALETGAVKRNSELHRGIEQFIELYASGKSLEIAQRKTGVRIEVISRLAEMGINAVKQPKTSPEPLLMPETESAVVATREFTLGDFEEPKKVKAPKVKKQKQVEVAKAEVAPEPLGDFEEPKKVKAPKVKKQKQVEVAKAEVAPEPNSADLDSSFAGDVEPTQVKQKALAVSVPEMTNKLITGLYAANLSGEIGWKAKPVWQVNGLVRLLRTRNYSLEEARAHVRLDPRTLDRILQLSDQK